MGTSYYVDMLNDCPRVGISRTHTSKSTVSQRQPQALAEDCFHTQAVDHLPSVSPSVKPTFRKFLKRSRPQDDVVDEDDQSQRKKRRLRLNLVTSRLSRPYATPATHIIGTKAWRVGAWARQRFAGGKLLRKAAILNWRSMKSKRDPSGAMKISNCSTGRTPSTYGHTLNWSTTDTDSIRLCPAQGASRTTQQAIAPPATFQMPSDYDAFDYEEDVVDDDVDEEDEEADEGSSDVESQAIYSDFRRLESSDTDPEFFDTSWSFANIELDCSEVDQCGKEIKLVMENEKTDEVSIAPPGIFSPLHPRMMRVGV